MQPQEESLASIAIKETCFSSHALVNQLVINWFKEKLQTMSLDESLCEYNLGIKINNCEYEKKYKQLN